MQNTVRKQVLESNSKEYNIAVWSSSEGQGYLTLTEKDKKCEKNKYGVLILNLGECWSGVNAENTYRQDGPSQECLTIDFLKCGPQDKYCVGEQNTNFVYMLNGECFLGQGLFWTILIWEVARKYRFKLYHWKKQTILGNHLIEFVSQSYFCEALKICTSPPNPSSINITRETN